MGFDLFSGSRVSRSTEMLFVGYYLPRASRRRDRRAAQRTLGVRTWNDTYDLFFYRLGDGRSVMTFRHSLQNTRDAFDAMFDGPRRGWRQPDGITPTLPADQLDMFARWQLLSDAQCLSEVSKWITR